MATATEVDALPGHTDQPFLYAWSWLGEGASRLRVRSFPTWAGIDEDEASGAAAVLMGAALGRELQISQGVGSEIVARPGPGGTVEIAGGATWSRSANTSRTLPSAGQTRGEGSEPDDRC